MKKAIALFLVILLSSCEYEDDSFKIINKSQIQIAVEESNHKDSISFNNTEYYLSNVIEPDSTESLTVRGKIGAWKKYVRKSPEKEIFVYVFSKDTLIKYKGKKTMYDLYAQSKYIKRFEFSEKQLDDIHWKVVFAP